MRFCRNSFYWLTSILLLVCGSGMGISLPETDLARQPIASQGVTRPAVVVPLSSIVQEAGGNPQTEILNANEEDEAEFMREVRRMEGVPQVIPRHMDSYDGTHSRFRAATALPAPPVKSGIFAGIPNTGGNQPDSIIAVGPAHVLAAVNTSIAIYTKSGHRRFMTSFQHWFEPLEPTWGGSVIFDPRVLYDQYSNHYIFMCTTRRADRRSWFLISVSKTSNPEGEWAFWALDMQMNGNVRHEFWADFPRLGVDQNAVYVTANMYTFATYIFRYSKIRVLRKSDLYAFGALPYYEFRQMIDATGVYAHSIEPAHSYGNVPAEFLVNTRVDSANKITVWKVTVPPAGNPSLARIAVPVSSYQVPPFALQKGGGAVLQTATEGTGVLSVISRNGYIYTVHPIAKNWGSGEVSALRFYQLKQNGDVVQEITYGSDGVFYYMPSVAVNSKGHVVLAFSRSSASEFAGFFIAGRKSTAPSGQISASVALQKGLANYQVVFSGSNIGRWGDYNGITVAGDDSFWAFGEYAATATEWQTLIARLVY